MRLAAILWFTFVAAVAAEERAAQNDTNGDRFVAGGAIAVTTPVAGDLLAAGGNVDVDTRIGGDLIAAGGNLRVRGEVDQSAFIAGGQVLVNGVIGGDVWATAGRLTLGPNARIGGKLRYASRAELARDPAAVVAGGVQRLAFESSWPHGNAQSRWASGWLWTVGLALLAAVLVAAAPRFTAGTAQALHARPWLALLLGLIALICVPMAALLLFVTVIGSPLALVAMLAYPPLLLLAYALTAVSIGDLAVQRLAAVRAASIRWRASAAFLAVLAVGLLTRLPWIGWLVVLLALLAGLGALLLQWRRPPTPARATNL